MKNYAQEVFQKVERDCLSGVEQDISYAIRRAAPFVVGTGHVRVWIPVYEVVNRAGLAVEAHADERF